MAWYQVSYRVWADNIERAITDLTYPVNADGYGLDNGRDLTNIDEVRVYKVIDKEQR